MEEKYGLLKKGLIVLAIPFVIQLVFLGVLLKSQIDNAKAQSMAIHTMDVIAEVESLTRRLVSLRSNLLGLVLSGDEAANPFTQVADEVTAQVERLHNLIDDNPGQQGRIDSIAVAIRDYLAWMAESHAIVGRDRDSAIARIKTEAGKRKLDAIQADLGIFRAEEERLDVQRRGLLETSTAWLLRSIVLGSLLTMALAVGLVTAYSRKFARRIAILVENARRLAEGKALLTPIKGNDEIGLLAKSFEAMAKSLEERDRENEMFIYSVSHDLRSPLVNLQGFSRELSYAATELKTTLATVEKSPAVAAKIDRIVDGDVKSAIHFIQNAVTRLSAIIDSLLRLSRAGRVEYRMEALDMNALVVRVVESQRGSTAEKGATIDIGVLPAAWGDVTIVEQIVSNLLTNAVKYLDPERPGRIEVSGERSGGDGDGFATYHVRDNGLGIATAHQGKLFIAFQRLHPGVADGQGVGLALVRRMVERHGGKIWADSEAGVGSTFHVSLPAAPVTADPVKPGEDSSTKTGASA